MRYILFILSILISGHIYGAEFYVDNQHSECGEDNSESTGNGTEESPFCTIQRGIDKAGFEASAQGDRHTVHVSSGTYNEIIIIEDDLILLGDDNDPKSVVITAQGIEDVDDIVGSVVTIRPPSGHNSEVGAEGFAIDHPNVEINGFVIQSGRGTKTSSSRWERDERRVGSGLFAYVTTPTIKNCIFFNNGTGPSYTDDTPDDGSAFATDDPDDFVYPASPPPQNGDDERDRIDYDSQELEYIEGDIIFENVKFIDNLAINGSSVYINGFADNTIFFENCEFDVFSTSDDDVPEYWVKGAPNDDGEKTTFNYINCNKYMAEEMNGESYNGKTAVSGDMEIDPSIGNDEDCSGNSKCASITRALSLALPLPGQTLKIALVDGEYNTDKEIYPLALLDRVIIEGASKEGTVLDAGSQDNRVIECNIPLGRDEDKPVLKNMTLSGGNENKGAGILLDNCSPVLEDLIIEDNISTEYTYGEVTSSGKGGGIYIKQSNPLLKSVEIRDNFADYGAGIYCDDSDLEISGGIIEENGYDSDEEVWSSGGGGIYIDDDAESEIIDVEIKGNMAENGGGIYINKSTLNMSSDSEIKNNKSRVSGAGIYAVDSELELSDIDINDNQILKDNNSDSYGVGLYLEDTGPVTLTNVDIKYNSIYQENTGNVDVKGAGIYINDSRYANVTIEGGIISNNGNCEDNNPRDDNCISAYQGGGVNLEDLQSLTIKDITISGNYAEKDGGGMFLNAINNIELERVVCNDNDSGQNGGCMYLEDVSVEIMESEIKDNISIENGGGIYSIDCDHVKLSNVVVSNNFANQWDECSDRGNGGGIYAKKSTFELTNVEITKNKTLKNGGGIYNRESQFFVSNTTIADNIAYDCDDFLDEGYSAANEGEEEGDGIYVHRDGGEFDIVNTIFWNNYVVLKHEDIDILFNYSLADQTIVKLPDDDDYSENNFNSCVAVDDFNLNNPEFINPDNFDYQIGINSSCIDNATAEYDFQPNFVTDINMTADDYCGLNPDIGAYEFLSENCIEDCNGVPGGDAVVDECGICNGDGIPEGACDCDGNLYDECGECGGDGIPEGACDCDGNVVDCAGICGGDAIVDVCGECGGLGFVDPAGNPDENYDCDGNCQEDAEELCNSVLSGGGVYCAPAGTDTCSESEYNAGGCDEINSWYDCAGEYCGSDHHLFYETDCGDEGFIACDGGRCYTCDDGSFDYQACIDANQNWIVETDEYGYDLVTNPEECNGSWIEFADPDWQNGLSESAEVEEGNPEECYCTAADAEMYCEDFCSALGDINADGYHNVMDIVGLANCVLTITCSELYSACSSDINADGNYNVMDIVGLANCVLTITCDELGRISDLGSIDDATESRLSIMNNNISIEADGFIGGVQMTLTHGDDFSIEMTNRALFADYLTDGNETRLLVITPETEELFSYSGTFNITDIIVANSYEKIHYDIIVVSDFTLSKAYPNPFNPSTAIDFTVPVESDILIQIFDIRGQLIETLISENKDFGNYSITWNANNYSSGLYYLKMSAFQGEGIAIYSESRKLMLIK